MRCTRCSLVGASNTIQTATFWLRQKKESLSGASSRNTDRISKACQDLLKDRLEEAGWTGDDLAELIRTEMHHLLLDDPRLSADSLARVLAKKGKQLPV